MYLQHEAIHFDVNVLVWLLRVVQLVEVHELLQAVAKVQGKQVEPHQAAGVQNQLQGVQLHVQVGAGDCRGGGDGGVSPVLLNHWVMHMGEDGGFKKITL